MGIMFLKVDEEACVNPLEEDEEYNGVSSSENVKKDLSDWQERHAVLVLSKSKVFDPCLCLNDLNLPSFCCSR